MFIWNVCKGKRKNSREKFNQKANVKRYFAIIFVLLERLSIRPLITAYITVRIVRCTKKYANANNSEELLLSEN